LPYQESTILEMKVCKMKRIKQYAYFLPVFLAFIQASVKAQSINGDTIYVDSKAEIRLEFPSKQTDFYLIPSDAPYNLKTLSKGFTIIAKKKNTAPAQLSVIENKRTHRLTIAYKKNINYDDPKETYYDYSTLKKLKERVKELEEREKKYNDLISNADKLMQTEDYINAKLFYTQALGLLNRPWPTEQIKKINKLIKKEKKKKH
jgi:hypothetical protein